MKRPDLQQAGAVLALIYTVGVKKLSDATRRSFLKPTLRCDTLPPKRCVLHKDKYS